MTILERLTTALIDKGWVEDKKAITRKYRVMLPPESFGHPNTRIYLGRAGALRFGRSIADSVPWDKFRADLLKEIP